MDISGLKLTAKPQGCAILHPVTKEDTGIVVFCISPESPDYRPRALETAREEAFKDGEISHKKLAESLENRKKELIAGFVTGWENIEIDEQPFPYSPENAVRLVSDFPWIAEQINEFCGKREHFFANAKTI